MHPNIVILEGCDGTGKTTYANAYMKDRPWVKYIHFGRPENGENPFEKYMELLNSVGPGDTVIVDRFHWSSYVYSLVKRRKMDMGILQFRKIDKKLMTMVHKIVLFDSTVPKIKQRFKIRGEDYVMPLEIPIILQLYRGLYNKSKLNKSTIKT